MTVRRLRGRVPVCVGLLWLGMAGSALAQTASFAPPVSYATGADTTGIALADVNHDLKLDLIVSACENNLVRVRLGNGDGTFGTENDYPVGDTPYGVVVADFNGDTHPDIATANLFSDDVSILFGDGTGAGPAAFSAPVNLPGGSGPQGIVAADFNGDAFIDLAVTNSNSDTVSVFLNDGLGAFTEVTGSPFLTGAFPSAIRAATLDSGATVDLVVTNTFDGTLTILLGVGNGTFVPGPVDPVFLEGCFCPIPVDVVTLDANGDGFTDLAVADVSNDVLWLLLGAGDGSFLDDLAPRFTGFGPANLTVADFNGDGIDDVAVVNTFEDTAQIFLGDGTDLVAQPDTFTTATDPDPLTNFSSPLWLASGDLNGDGKIDLAAGQEDTLDTAILLNTTCCYVTVTRNGTGTGAVASVTDGIDCGSTCVAVFDLLSAPELVATPAPGSLFAGWSGDCTGTGSCELPALGADAHVTATFDVLALSNAAFPDGNVGLPYSSPATTTNGTAPFVFSLQTGTLPPGLVLDPDTNTIVGVPTISGTFNFTLAATDAGGAAGTHAYSIHVNAAPTTTFVVDEAVNYRDAAQTIALTATVSGAGDVNSSTVTFTVRNVSNVVIGVPVTSPTVVEGIAGADYLLPGGTAAQTLTITAVYNGDASYTTSTGTGNLVVGQAESVTAAANATATYNDAAQSVPLSATVTSLDGAVNAGTVAFTILDGSLAVVGSPVTSGPVSAGAASASYTLPGGTVPQTLTIKADYNGSTNFAASTDEAHTLIVGAAPSTTAVANATATYNDAAQSVALTASVTSANGTVNAGTVTFTVRNAGNVIVGVPVTSGTVSAGAASASYTLPGGVNAQVLTITAVYNASTNFTTSTDATHTLAVAKAQAITLGANAAATYMAAAQSVTLTASVTSANGTVNAGTVTFTVRDAGSVMVGVPAISGTVSAGAASASYTLPGGTNAQVLTITAVYDASTNFTTSSFSTNTLTVSPASTTTTTPGGSAGLSASPQSVPLTAMVTGGGGVVGAGSVTFTVRTAGNVVVGSSVSGTVAGGAASAFYTLPGGTAAQTLTVTASYGATTNFAASAGTGPLVVGCSVTVGSTTQPAIRLGQPFSMTFTATGADDATFALTGTPPPGLTLTGATLSGTPTALGRFDVTTTATSPSTGCSAGQAFTFRVMRPPVFVAGAGGGNPAVRVFDNLGTMTSNFFADDPSFAGGMRVAVGDITGDGVADTITAPGPGGAAIVRVFDGVSGVQVRQIAAYPFGTGIYVAAGDVNSDGIADIVTGRDGSPAEVRVFDGQTSGLIADFLAYPSGGVRVAVGDLDADGFAEVITAPTAGGEPQIRVFDRAGTPLAAFQAYDPAFTGGVFVAAGDIDGDGRADIITGPDAGAAPLVVAFSGVDLHVLRSFMAYATIWEGGVRVAAGDLDLDGRADIITAAGPGGGPHVRLWDGATGDETGSLFAFTPGFTGGVYVAAAAPQSRMAIDLPPAGSTVPPVFAVAGWATDGSPLTGSGVDAIHVWAFPVAGGVPIFVGATTDFTISRPDVAGLFGGFYSEPGYLVIGGPLPAGVYDLYVAAHSGRSGTFNNRRVIRIVVSP